MKGFEDLDPRRILSDEQDPHRSPSL